MIDCRLRKNREKPVCKVRLKEFAPVTAAQLQRVFDKQRAKGRHPVIKGKSSGSGDIKISFEKPTLAKIKRSNKLLSELGIRSL